MDECDGVICFGGEDWWYHNRGHFDMQMMRELSTDVPVLYVNSIGMRVPRLGEGIMFWRRVARKLRSIRRGTVFVRDRFAVMSPIAGPGTTGRMVSRAMLPRQVRQAARRLGIHRPLLWVACPPGARYIDAIDPVVTVYQRTDRYEAFSGVDEEEIRSADQMLKRRAALTVFCSRSLLADEQSQCRRAIFVDHGVDYDRFAAAGRQPVNPPDTCHISGLRVGFVGGVDAHTFDPELFRAVATELADISFIIVGACSLPADWCPLPNVHQLGQRDYEQVPQYMAACDVLIMPWNRSPWIEACNPVKLKEYLAVGRPVVSTPFRELEHYKDFVSVAQDATAFAAAIRSALQATDDSQRRRTHVRTQTWQAKADLVRQELVELGFGFRANP